MATEKIALEIEVKGAGSVKELKQGIKDARNELLQFEVGSEGFKRAQKKVSELTDTLKDLGDSAKIQGTGVERLGASFGLLRESFASGDLEKAKLAFTGIGQAMSAIPIFLLIEGVKFLIDNWKSLSAAFDESAQKIIQNERALKDLSNEVDINKTKTDALIITKEAELNQLIRQGAAYQQIIDKNNEINGLKQDQFAGELKKIDKEFANLIEKQRILKEEINFSDFLPEALGGNATEKELKNIDDAIAALSVKRANFYNDAEKANIANLEKNLSIIDEAKKKNEEAYNDRIKKELDAVQKRLAEEEKLFYNKQGAELKAEAEFAAEKEKQRLAAEQAYIDKQLDLDRQFAALSKQQRDVDTQNEIDRNKKLVDDKKKSEAAKLQAAQSGLLAAQNLSQAFFAIQLNRAKGNADAELKIKKQMFEIDKAFNIARAVQDGIRSVQAALTIPPPGGQILAAVNGALAAANIAKIAATQFDGGSVSTDIGNAGALASLPQTGSSIPQASQFGAGNGQLLNGGNNEINQSNAPLTVRAYVVESEITQSQNTVSKEKRTSTFG